MLELIECGFKWVTDDISPDRPHRCRVEVLPGLAHAGDHVCGAIVWPVDDQSDNATYPRCGARHE